MHNKHIITCVALISLIFGASFYYATTIAPVAAHRTIARNMANVILAGKPTDAVLTMPPITLIAGTTTVEIKATSQTTVLAAMRAASSKGFTFSGHEYPSLGFFVESINGISGDSNTSWILHINNATSTRGASQAVIAPGDTIEWQLEKIF